jgi:hypothetical protein
MMQHNPALKLRSARVILGRACVAIRDVQPRFYSFKRSNELLKNTVQYR